MTERTQLLIAAGIGIGVCAATAFTMQQLSYYLSRPKPEKIPEKWVKVAEVTDLLYYPLKSCQPVHDVMLNCEEIGFSKFGVLRDRVFVITDLQGKAVTARDYPKIVLIDAKFKLENTVHLVLIAPGIDNPMKINLTDTSSFKKSNAIIWGNSTDALDCGDDAANWISKYVLNKVEGLRIHYYPSKKPRSSASNLPDYPLVKTQDYGGYSDLTGYMLMSEDSVNDLNTRLEDPTIPKQFRPNIVVKGAEPYAEDKWDYLKIGDAIFRNIKPCTRCIFTTINPYNGTKHVKGEPLKTLRKYRQLPDSELAKREKYSPAFGINLGIRKKGTIKVGDFVYINVA